MSSLSVTVDGGVVAVKPSGYEEAVRAAVYRELPSAHWVKTKRRWEMPKTSGSFRALERAVPRLEEAGASTEIDHQVLLAWEHAAQARRPVDAEVAETALPFETTSTPWRHQRCSFWFLDYARRSLGAGLLDCGMRTGKTKMVLDHLQGVEPAKDRRALVVAPTAVVRVWEEQAARHVDGARLKVVALDSGSVKERVEAAVRLLTSGEPVVAVVGWSVMERSSPADKKALRAALKGATVVADEVHYAKAPGSSRSATLAFISRDARFRVGASGTPLSHSPLDAYAVFRFLDPGIWGTSFARFRERYAQMGGFGGYQVLRYQNLDELAERMAPYVFRATRDVLDLPSAQHVEVPVSLPSSAMKVYRDLRDEAVAEIKSGTLTVTNALAKLTRLAQVASGHLPAADGSARPEIIHEEKQSALADLLNSCDPTEPWVVFGRFHHDLDVAARASKTAGRNFYELSGRKKELDTWRKACARGEGAVLVAQIQSGGIGISLVEAAFCAYLSVGYSLAEYEQSLARIHGPEQARPVAYYHLVARGTVDVLIRRALEKRADVLKEVTGALASYAAPGR